jgi:hypothetical protein
MFDRIVHAPTTVTGPRELKVNVKEERAPTDDSVRLLSEMQEKARKDIVAAIAVESNIMKGVVLSFGPDFNECGRTKFYLKFDLNGREHVITVVEPSTLGSDNIADYGKKLARLIADAVTDSLLDALSQDASAQQHFRSIM